MKDERTTLNGKKGAIKASSGKYRRWYVLLFLLLILWAGLNLAKLMSLPSEVKEITSCQDLMCSTDFRFRVYPKPSLLFPEATVLTAGDSFFTQVTQDVEVEFNTSLRLDPPLPLTGTYQVWAVVEAPELWTRSFLLQDKTEFTGEDNGVVKISAAFPLNLEERLAFAQAIEDEIGVGTREGYNIYLKPVFSLTSDNLPSEMKKEFEPQFGFCVNASQLNLLGEREQKDNQQVTSETTKATTVMLFGQEQPLLTARYIFALLLLLGLLGLVIPLKARLVSLRQERRVFSPSYINRRYRNRIISVKSMDKVPGTQPVMHMENFTQLLRIADEREKPIMLVQDEGDSSLWCRYYVTDDSYVYVYTASEPLSRSLEESLVRTPPVPGR